MIQAIECEWICKISDRGGRRKRRHKLICWYRPRLWFICCSTENCYQRIHSLNIRINYSKYLPPNFKIHTTFLNQHSKFTAHLYIIISINLAMSSKLIESTELQSLACQSNKWFYTSKMALVMNFITHHMNKFEGKCECKLQCFQSVTNHFSFLICGVRDTLSKKNGNSVILFSIKKINRHVFQGLLFLKSNRLRLRYRRNEFKLIWNYGFASDIAEIPPKFPFYHIRTNKINIFP